MKSQKFVPPNSNTQNSSLKAPFRCQSPFKQVSHNTSKNASKDLESYILRNSTESIKNQKKTSYNFQEVDQFEQQDHMTLGQSSCSNSPHRERDVQPPKKQKRSSSKDKKGDISSVNESNRLTRFQQFKKQSSKENIKPTKPLGNLQSERSMSNGARLSELCPEDKAKIGELVKKLAIETKQKQEYAKKYEQEKLEMSKRLKDLEQMSVLYEDERDQMKDKFSQSLQMLKQLKEDQQKVEREKQRREEELQKVKDELKRREQEVERQRIQLEQEKEEKNRQLNEMIQESQKKEQQLQSMKESKQQSFYQNIGSNNYNNDKNINISQSHNNFLRPGEMSVNINDQTVSTLKEITDLKTEILKLTNSLRHLKMSPEQDKKSKERSIRKHSQKNEEQESESDHDESMEQTWWKNQHKSSQIQPEKHQPKKIEEIRSNPHKESIKKSQENSNRMQKSSLQTNSIDREDLQEMKIDDLYALQDQLAKNLEMTNNLLQSKLTNSNKKGTLRPQSNLSSHRGTSSSHRSGLQSSGVKKLTIDSDRMAKLIQKAQNELDEYDDDDESLQSTPRPKQQAPPEPESLSKREELLAQKMQIFKEIQQRFNKKDQQLESDSDVQTGRFQEAERENTSQLNQSKSGGSFYKNLIQQQTQILHNQKQGKPPTHNLNQSLHLNITNMQSTLTLQPQTIPSEVYSDEEDDLVYSLNQRSEYNPMQKSSLSGTQQTISSQQTQQQFQSFQPKQTPSQASLHQVPTSQTHLNHYDDSLFNIIDEIEYEQKAQESVILNQSQHSDRSMQASASKRPNSFFEQQLQESQNIMRPQNQYNPNLMTQSQMNHNQRPVQNYYEAPPQQQILQQNQHQQNKFTLLSQQLPNQQQQQQTPLPHQQQQYSYKQNPFYLQAKQEVETSQNQSRFYTQGGHQQSFHQQSNQDIGINASYSRINQSSYLQNEPQPYQQPNYPQGHQQSYDWQMQQNQSNYSGQENSGYKRHPQFN